MHVDVVAIGNLIVNAVATCDVAEVPGGVGAGDVQLVDEGTLRRLEDAFPPRLVEPGGTSVNTIMHLARLGWRCLFWGEAGADPAAEMFRDRFRSLGIGWMNSVGAGATGRCLVLVRPDGETALLTALGAAGAPLDVSGLDGVTAKVLLTEVYQFDRPRADEALGRLSSLAQSRWLSLSSPAAIKRHRRRVLDLLDVGSWTLVGTYAEFCALTCTPSAGADGLRHGTTAFAALLEAGLSDAYVTAGSAGAWHIAEDGVITHAPATPGVPLIDPTGAGDAFLAGVLHEWLSGTPVKHQLATGARLAGDVVQHWGTFRDGHHDA